MGRKPAPQPLALSDATVTPEEGGGPGSRQTVRQVHTPTTATSFPASPLRSPRSPLSPFRLGSKRSSRDQDKQDQQGTSNARKHRQLQKSSPSPSPNPSPVKSETPVRNQSQSQSHSQNSWQPHRLDRDGEATSPYLPLAAALHDASLGSPSNPIAPGGQRMSRGAENPEMAAATLKYTDASSADHSVQKPNPSLPSKSDLSLASVEHETTAAQQSGPKKPKPKPFGLLGRSKSQRDKDRNRSLSREREPAVPAPSDSTNLDRSFSQSHSGPRTAPIHDRSLREMMSSAVRNRSEDRSSLRDHPTREQHREKEQLHPRAQPPSSHNNGGTFFSGLKSSSTKAAGLIRDGLFGKGQRTAPSPEKDPVIDDEHYVIKVINLPLIEQTRKTRISKKLEDSRDKTEFWMPAFPWRAIDYLNYKGCDVEGLYRVPGSGPQIKKWQRRFDEEFDVDLFAQDDLYDINIIGSMLKAWLRELPDELFPKEAQDRISRECAGAETVPQMLIDELSNLSPFNYYLLFAITCHLSLLLAHSDKNKMDFRNLCICFQPCMKIDVFCFKFLVCDWRDCWKGCKLEPKFIEDEYQLFDQPPPRGLAEARKPAKEEPPSIEEQPPSSSDRTPSPSHDAPKKRTKKKNLQEANGGTSSPAASLTINSERAAPGVAEENDIRPLSPIKPLSPMNF